MASKKIILNTSVDENYCLLGIAADEQDYKLCWLINKELSTDFERIDDLEMYHKKTNSEQIFSIFQYYDEESLLTYRIIKNRSENGFYLDELKNLDYLIHIQGEIFPDEISGFIKEVSKISSVRLCIPVDLRKIKDKSRLELW